MDTTGAVDCCMGYGAWQKTNPNQLACRMFSKITYTPHLETVVARVNHSTGELQINSNLWPRMSDAHRDYVLIHEDVHLKTGLRDETLVTQLALMQFIQGITDENRAGREAFLTQLSEIAGSRTDGATQKSQWSNSDSKDPVTAIANAVGDLSDLVGAFVNKRIAKIQAAVARDQMSHEQLMYEMYQDQQQRNNALEYFKTSSSGKIWMWLIAIMVVGAALAVFYKKTV